MTREQIMNRMEYLLKGMTIQSFRLLEGGTIILYLMRETSLGRHNKASRLWIDSAWRICDTHRVVVGSLDDNEKLMTILDVLLGKMIESIRLDGIPGDISLLIESGIVVETFARSTEDDQWEFRQPDGLRVGLREGNELYESIEEPDSNYKE